MARCGKNLAEIFDECHIINESTYTSILPVLSYFSGEICTFFKINDLDTTKVDRSMKYKNNLTKVRVFLQLIIFSNCIYKYVLNLKYYRCNLTMNIFTQ